MPRKAMPATSGKRAGHHNTKDCYRNSQENCVNCVQDRENNFKHNAFFHECPAMVKARAFVIWETGLDGEKKTNTRILSENFFFS